MLIFELTLSKTLLMIILFFPNFNIAKKAKKSVKSVKSAKSVKVLNYKKCKKEV